MHVYWASMFILPFRIMLDLEQLMRGFLWCQGDMRRGKAKVAWETVCLPKNEGGLGLRRLEEFNKALITSHIWILLTNKESLWVQWIHCYKLRGRSFWDVPFLGNMSWSWRKILHLRPIIRQFVWYKIGDGNMASVWFDNWCAQSPLIDIIMSRDMYRAGLDRSLSFKDSIVDGNWIWPCNWYSKYPLLGTINAPTLNPDSLDKLV